MQCSPALANPRLQSRLPAGAQLHPHSTQSTSLTSTCTVPDIETGLNCGGQLRVIASIEEPEIVERILNHLGGDSGTVDPGHPSQAPPPRDRLL